MPNFQTCCPKHTYFFIWPYLLFDSSIVSRDSVDSKPYGDGPGLSDSVDGMPFKGGTSRGGGG